MLFSDTRVAEYIQERFEPVWQSVRPVPTVRIDFGDGRVVTRTLNGNIATYVCSAEATVIDILPGIYDRDAYLAELGRLATIVIDPDTREVLESRLRAYHLSCVASLRSVTLQPIWMDEVATANSVEQLAGWKALRVDTRINETVNRPRIHEHLAKLGLVQPADVTKWLYREVLHADLDDPYLGLGHVLFGSYPFQEEDQASK